jgi:nitrogen regulatory protein PII
MFLQESTNDASFSLLTVIVNRGKGSKVLQFLSKLGVISASCLLGKGTINNHTLERMEMNEVNKEIIVAVVQTEIENEILEQVKIKFKLDKQNQGIAFTTSLAGMLKIKQDSSLRWRNSKENINHYYKSDYTMVFLVVDKGKAEDVIDISQDAGFYGATVIKARGAASELNIVLDMIVEPEKEAVLMLTESHRVKELVKILNEDLKFKEENTGIVVMADINQTIGLYQKNR